MNPPPVQRESPVREQDSGDEPRVPIDFPWPIVLGIDPGSRVLGYGALVLGREGPRLLACGILRTSGQVAGAGRLGDLRQQLDGLFERLRPRHVVVEEAFAALNVQSALRIGEARGVVLAGAVCSGAEVSQYPPAVAKRALVGNGRADKHQVARMVAHELGQAELAVPLDATDALALALTFVYKQGAPRVGRS